MADPTTDTRTRGWLSRRQMIRASAIAGAGAWAAPAIIDSLSSPAAASSGHNYACSKGYIFYSYGGNVYYTGFKTGTAACNTCGDNNPGGDDFNNCAVTGVCLFKGEVGGTCSNNGTYLKYTLSPSSCNDSSTMTEALFDASCNSHVSLDAATGKIVTAAAGVKILGGFAFTAGSWQNICPSSDSTGNTITMPSGCNDA